MFPIFLIIGGVLFFMSRKASADDSAPAPSPTPSAAPPPPRPLAPKPQAAKPKPKPALTIPDEKPFPPFDNPAKWRKMARAAREKNRPDLAAKYAAKADTLNVQIRRARLERQNKVPAALRRP